MSKPGMSFSVVRKKNPFQKHKEEEKSKKQREEAEAAALYEEFVASFDADDGGAKAFVRGETIQPGSAPGSSSSGSKKSSKYIPSFLPPNFAGSKTSKKKDEKSVFETSRPSKNKPKAIDTMLEQIKREQEKREERVKAQAEGRETAFDVTPEDFYQQGSFDNGDPHTTNLYVGNLSPVVDEDILKREFGQFGAIASVKIMWPRSEEERRRGRNCGFVAFMTREGAAGARDNLSGKMLYDNELHVGWGKSVPLPAMPIYPPPEGLAAGRLGATIAPPSQQAAPWAASAAPVGTSGFSSGPPPQSTSTGLAVVAEMSERPPDPEHIGAGPEIQVVLPEPRERFIIDTMADYVSVDGSDFEQAVMEKERKNPEYAFLYDLESPAHAYYRWRLYSLLQGDSLRSWRIAPFVMVTGSGCWIPPPMTSEATASTRTAAQGGGGPQKERDRTLSDTQRDRFEDMLRSLTMERDTICDAMAFALDNADSAQEVTEILTEALTIKETPAITKVSRLFLVSDILHNSTAPVKNASKFRTRLQESLPGIFESIAECYRACDSRITQETLRRHVLRVLRVWRGWFIFSDDYLNGLQATFLHSGSQSLATANAAKTAELEKELSGLGDESLERRCRVAGLSTSGSRRRLVDRILMLEAYLRGDFNSSSGAEAPGQGSSVLRPAEQSSSIRPSSGSSRQPGKSRRPATGKGSVSKWAMMDDVPGGDDDVESNHSDDMFGGENANQKGVTVSHTPATPADAHPVEQIDDERHRKLRQVEVDLLLLREDLEEEGRPKGEVDRRVEEKRRQLVAAVDAALAQPSPKKPKEESRHKDSHRDSDRPRSRDGRDREPDRDSSHRDRDRAGRERRRGSTRSRSPRRRDSRSHSSHHGRSRSRSRSPRHSRHR